MNYDENRVNDQIHAGLQLKKEIDDKAQEMYENMFYSISSGLSVKNHDESAKQCAQAAAVLAKYASGNDKYWNLVIKAIKAI